MDTPSAHVFFSASKFNSDHLKLGLKKLKRLGLTIHPFTSPAQSHDPYCGSLEERLRSVQVGLKPEPTLLIAARGGYGTVEILPHLPQDRESWEAHVVCGFSDITALHALLSNLGLPSLHGPMLATALWNEQNQDDDQRFLDAIANRALAPLALKGESSDWQGRLVGGNLTVLASLMGTPWQLKLNEGDILFLEDIAEPPYKLFRSLYQLSHSPNFASCQIILGHFTNCARPPQSIQTLMHNLMKPYSNSWNYGFPAGHEAPNACIWLGKKASITQNQLICIA